MKILVVNAGSSSLKYQLFDMTTHQVIAKGNCDRIGVDGELTHVLAGQDKIFKKIDMPTHAQAVNVLIDTLTHKEYGCISDMSEISAIGHRIVHGGPWLIDSVLVDDKVLADLEKCLDLAPLHTMPHLLGIKGCLDFMPGTPQVLVMDTAFHQTMPPEAYTYPIDYDVAKRNNIRRYGFHGTSHRYVSGKAIEYLGNPNAKIVTCHLGNGSSISAVNAGKCIDTSMGFTPLEGVIMGSRCGAIDPALVSFIMEKENIPVEEMGKWLNKNCGFLGVSGLSSDLREIENAVHAGHERATLAYNILAYQIKKYIGSYAAAMNGLDCIVFTAGIGENNQDIRRMSLTDMDYFGIKLDLEKNNVKGPKDILEINLPDSKVKVLIIPTNEELVIASDTMAIVENLK